MNDTMELLTDFNRLAGSVRFKKGKRNTKLQRYNETELTLIGSGRSAYVFRIASTKLALKVFFPPFEELAEKEASIYRKLDGIPVFPKLHAWGGNFIVIDYIEGKTLFECLVKGKRINGSVLIAVDQAILQAKSKGLNPSDIHLHNILIMESGDVQLIDVVRFEQSKQCTQWEDLKKGYYRFYLNRFFPKKIPSKLLYGIAFLYKRNWLATIIR
jgi:predicted Ser/Thr protein kinase